MSLIQINRNPSDGHLRLFAGVMLPVFAAIVAVFLWWRFQLVGAAVVVLGVAFLFGQRLDVNRATVEELRDVPGISRRVARNIVFHRGLHGEFRELAELEQVPGIGAKRVAQLARYLHAEVR